MIREKKFLVSVKTADTAQSVYLIVFAVALGLVLILAGLFIILFRSQDNNPESLFGLPLVVGGMFAPTSRDTTTENEPDFSLSEVRDGYQDLRFDTQIDVSGLSPDIGARGIHSILPD